VTLRTYIGGAANQTRIFTESLKQVGQQIETVILPLFWDNYFYKRKDKSLLKTFGRYKDYSIVVVAALAAVIGPLVLLLVLLLL
jgi:hypothetical protein